MGSRSDAKPHGQIRQSQVVTTFGPGAPLDLPNYSVLVGGLDHWYKEGREEIHELRLIEKLKHLLEIPSLKLYAPPPENEDPTAPRTGIKVWRFPEWFITQDVEVDKENLSTRSRLLIPLNALTKGKYIDPDRKKRSVVPVRFVRACRRGHIGDIDWYSFIHEGAKQCRRPLWIDERGTSGDLSEVVVRCDCGANRSMIDAARSDLKSLGNCDGSRLWLGRYSKESCGESNRLLVRTASNAYFPQVMSVISLPSPNEELTQAINQVWEHYLEYIETIEQLRDERNRKPPVKAVLGGYSDEEIFEEIRSRKSGGGSALMKPVKQAELEMLSASKEEIGFDRPDGNFFARSLPRAEWESKLMGPVERVVMVHRLREVVAQVGFTRFEASAPDVEGELEIGVQRASLAREISWLPAVENRGEGIFLGFKKDSINAWLQKPSVQERGKQLIAGFDSWKDDRRGSKRKFFGLPYIMLHSLSHLLITTVSLECGYPASSIRERIYAGEAGFGILLFTGSTDAEGTLGGLVEVGRRISHHLKSALDLGKLCSYDPVCAQHDPTNIHVRRFLHGSACHGCLLIAETSCEQHNDFLDRALVVPTVDNLGTEFFHLDQQ